MAARTYPVVRTVTMLIPELAQARLRELRDGPERQRALEWLLLGMSIEQEVASVDLNNMTVTVRLK